MKEKIKKLRELGWEKYDVYDNEGDECCGCEDDIFYEKTIGIQNYHIEFNDNDIDLCIREMNEDGCYESNDLKRNISFEWLAQFEELMTNSIKETTKSTRLTAQEARELTKSSKVKVTDETIENILDLIKDATLRYEYSVNYAHKINECVKKSLEDLGYTVTVRTHIIDAHPLISWE